MHLKGWAKPLSQWIIDAIENGKYIVYYDKKCDAELLKGSAVNPFGVVIEFQ